MEILKFLVYNSDAILISILSCYINIYVQATYYQHNIIQTILPLTVCNVYGYNLVIFDMGMLYIIKIWKY